MSSSRILKAAAGRLADSFLFARARARWAENQKNYALVLNRFEKAAVGGYLVLKDFSEGSFPPKHDDREITFSHEKNIHDVKPGVEREQTGFEIRKTPFWLNMAGANALEGYARLLRILLECGIREGDAVLELGCGSGWMSEFLAASGCHCVGTSINEFEVETARHREQILRDRNVGGELSYTQATMEEVDGTFGGVPRFRFIFVHAALHHAFDWREAVAAARRILLPGGWLLVCKEPNLLHTIVSYRVSKLDHTHEIGMSRRAITAGMQEAGFVQVKNYAPNPFGAIWLAAQVPESGVK